MYYIFYVLCIKKSKHVATLNTHVVVWAVITK